LRIQEQEGEIMKPSSGWKWKSITTSAVALLAVSAGAQAADQVKTVGNNEHERAAIQVVLDWTAAFAARDAEKVKSYMEEDVEFRLDPAERELGHGKVALQQTLDKIMPAIGAVKTLRVYAIGGAKEVLVISDRVDDFNIGGKTLKVTVGGYFRVNPQTRKIEEWLDAPLYKIDLPPPPPGAGPGAPGANGAPAPK
jgi:limonene-1,2-epoxide hydrolase